MERKLRITVDGRKYDVTVEDLSDVSSLPYSQPAGMVYMPPAAPAAFAPPATASAPAPAAPKPAGPAAAGDVVCTLGGVVESILVTLGQQVNAGDRVVIIEAMKMKTPMVAQTSGKVEAILVKVGEGVETGQVLLKLA
jgi:glutaconyl-CoA/methylmalonyl-CoA decarboxylase subunit gamma